MNCPMCQGTLQLLRTYTGTEVRAIDSIQQDEHGWMTVTANELISDTYDGIESELISCRQCGHELPGSFEVA